MLIGAKAGSLVAGQSCDRVLIAVPPSALVEEQTAEPDKATGGAGALKESDFFLPRYTSNLFLFFLGIVAACRNIDTKTMYAILNDAIENK
jgi:hypothetical protein